MSDVRKLVTTEKKKYIDSSTLRLENMYCASRNAAIDKLEFIDTLTDDELYKIVKIAYSNILSRMVEEKDTKFINKIFMNKRFLSTLTSVLGKATPRYDDIVRCNRLIYNYYTQKSMTPNKDIVLLLRKLSMIINVEYVPKLLGLDLDEDLISDLVNARSSSFNGDVNVKRVNFIIFTSSIDVMTEQMIIDIYCILFGNSIRMLFNSTMFDSYSDETLENASDDSREIYYIINLALLDILNSMESADIMILLKEYYNTARYSQYKPRFSLVLSDDYYRINQVIDQIKHETV